MPITSHTRETRARASEIKFVVDPEVGERIRSWARTHLERDPHGAGRFGDEYDITSLYFDTRARDVLHRRGSFGRAKYRVRRYDASDRVFLERKLRRPGLLIKRRTEVSLDDLAALDTRESGNAWDGSWFVKRLIARGLHPACQLSYRRMARGVATDSGHARLTLDQGVAARATDDPRFDLPGGIEILPEHLILELKFRREVPAIFRRLIAELRLSPQPASKYRIAMTTLNEGPAAGPSTHWTRSLSSYAIA